MANELLRTAQELLALQDIYIREAHAFSTPDFDPALNLGDVTIQFRLQPGEEIEHCELGNDQTIVKVIRYPIHAGLRLIKPGVEPTDSITREQIAAEISAIFVVKYSLTAPHEHPTEDMLSAFTENAIHHMWPYWREFLQATSARLRLPTIVLPMRRTGTLQMNSEGATRATQ